MQHIREFDDFLEKEVNLNPNRLERLHDSVKEVREFLSQNLDSFEKVEQQGSYALKTIIKPQYGDEYDADILLYMKHNSAKRAADYLNEVYECFQSSGYFRGKANRKTRSVNLEYASDFHLDVVPCFARRENHFICNSRNNEFEPTDGTAYRDWFNGKTDITSGNLKRVTRLLKYAKNRHEDLDIPSILLTTFIGNNIHGNETSNKARAKFSTVPDTLLVVTRRINSFLRYTSSMPSMRNPMLKSERFTNRHWNQGDYSRFKRAFNALFNQIHDAYHERDTERSLHKWRALFGGNFGR